MLIFSKERLELTFMKFDKPLFAILIGILSTIPYELFTRLLMYFGIGQYSIYYLASLIVTINRPTLIIGFIVSSLIGGLIATVLYYALNKLGSDYLVFKGMVSGLLSWVIIEFLFSATIEGKFIPIRTMNDYYSHLLGSIIFGAIMGFMFKSFLFKEHASVKP